MSLLNRANELKQEFINYRRDFHKHPELGMQENRTAQIVAEFLTNLGLDVKTGVANTGVVALLKGLEQGPTIGLRADMDALPILEQSEAPYSSKVQGVMHACGHDGHTAILMGVAKLLTECKHKIKGNVKFIFQPAEEGPGGALPMINEGVLQNPKVDMMFGLHISTKQGKAGQIAFKHGASSGGTGFARIKIKGYGGHGAHPHKSVDAIMASAHVLTALQTIISREIDPLEPVVITMGTIKGGYRYNVIADEVEMTGTIRTLSQDVKLGMPERFNRIIKGVCDSLRCTYELDYRQGIPSVINNEQATKLVEKVGNRVLGEQNVFKLKKASMGGEDFCYFSLEVPSCFFNLLALNESKNCHYPGHHPKYNFDEDCIPVGMAMLAESTLEALNELQ
ncbi:amidohydrolase [Clostridium sp. 'deep sea']|uniref:M20 metallopeptidase family protein n=1 Tax=Clostridium sp. 'deep sea' TaxID=2779445 RepID=UPI0018966728|nr:amidohydrolase [Clostridium sp. 'deep sea']QOR34092.1 amidohydrolase [Clostridium sp. 'deep sea']